MNNAESVAFPYPITNARVRKELQDAGFKLHGLSKREYFAGLAMQSLLAKRGLQIGTGQDAINMADELLKALEK